MSEEVAPGRITVSRDALRADLSEMELRLRIYFDDQLRHKADLGIFNEVRNKLDALDRGEWTPVHRRALVSLIEEQSTAKTDREWSNKERLLAVFGSMVATSMFVLSLVIAVRGGL